MLLDPNRFIAWDSKIARRFGLNHNKNSKSKSEYERFNKLINKFIERNKILVDCMVDYAEQYTEYKSYIKDNNPYEIKKLLDMIFWITYNRKDVFSNHCLASKFYDLTEEFVKNCILINDNR